MENQKSYTLRRCQSLGPAVVGRKSYTLSTRMKKVAPPPPPLGGVPSDQRSPLTNGDLRRQSSHEAPPIIHHHNNHHPAMSTTPGEDCAFDELLEGRMELEVVLPDNRTVRMTVDRRTPMMDLLIHAATANKISPGGHVIKVIPKVTRELLQEEEEEDHHHQRDVSYTPNTPVGSLDVTTVHIVPKPHPDIPIRRMPKLANQPFEQTFRLQVNLPRNQRMVLRVSPRITLSELKRQICNEKELDHSSHHLVHPAQPDTVLDLNSSLELYGCAEISLMSNSGLRDSIRSTSTHLIGYPRVEDEKKKKGILRLFSKKKKETTVETNTNGLGSRGVSPTRTTSISNRDSYQPKQSTKRKPAPAPPPPVVQPPPSSPLVIQSSSSINSRPESEISAKTDELGSTVSHSRHSSDSSGYHEPSVFSDCSQENKSPEASIVQGGGGGGVTTTNVLLCTPPKDVISPPDSLPLISKQTTPIKEKEHVGASLTNLKTVPCCSSTSIVSATRKRKAPQPPTPPVLQEVETPSSPEDLSPLATCKPVPDSQINALSEFTPSEDSEIASNKALEQVEEDEPLATVVSPAQSPETTRQEKEAISYLENVLKESETTSTLPTRLSPQVDKRDDVCIATEESSAETDIPIDKVDGEQAVVKNDESDFQVIETTRSDTPSASVLSLELPAADPASSPALITSTEEDLTCAEPTETESYLEQTIASLHSESERLPTDVDKIEEDYCGVEVETDTSDIPPVPLKNDILPQTEVSDSTSETSMQPDSRKNNFVSDFKEKPTEPNLQGEIECHTSKDEIRNTMNCKSKSLENVSCEEEPCTETQCAESETGPTSHKSKDTPSETSTPEMNTLNICKESAGDSPRAHRKLVNFALGCYKSENKDIYSESQEQPTHNSVESKTKIEKLNTTKADVTVQKFKRNAPEVKIVPFEERSKTDSNVPVRTGFKGQVQLRRTELSEQSTLPLTGRSSSLYNLTPQKKITEERPGRMDSLPEVLKRTQSDQNLCQEISVPEEKIDFINEQKRLHEEYLKLQAQFISWQKQLLNNQTLLQSEQIMPKVAFPDLEQYKQQLESLPEILNLDPSDLSPNDVLEELKTRSLPRQKSPSLPCKNNERPSTPVICQNSNGEELPSPSATQTSPGPSEQNEVARFIVNSTSNPENVAIYAQVNKQKKTNKMERATNGPANISDISNNIVSECPELPKKQPMDEDISKSQTLPRQKTQPISAFETSRTMTLNRPLRSKPQVVSVVIGSWQERHQVTDIDSVSVASSRSMFQSLENIPREHSKSTPPVEGKKSKSFNPSSDKKEQEKPAQPDVITAKVIIKRDGKDIIEDVTEQNGAICHASTTEQKITKMQKASEFPKSKTETKKHITESHVSHNKSSKPLVLLSSMKDDARPPSIQVLKKWPLSDMNEVDVPQKTAAERAGERSIWTELKASAKRPSGTTTKERVTRAEVDLRKHRTQKTESSSKSPKSKDPEPSTSKLHISKVNVNTDIKSSTTNSKNIASSNSGVTERQKKSFPTSKSETFNAELKDVLFKRASSLLERQDSESTPAESNYAELNGGSGDKVQSKTITVNGGSPPPPPPPPVSTMPTIPPAAPIPKSSQLLMDERSTSQKKVKSSGRKSTGSQSKTTPKKDPREELMLQIRGFGGRQALRKLFDKARFPMLKISPKKKASSPDPCTSSHPQ